MHSITVKKADLQQTLVENREAHIADYDITWEKYAEKLARETSYLHKKALNIQKGEKIDLYLRIDRPENHTDEYDRAIQMLEWEQGDTVKLDEDQFRQLVQDDWDWSHSFRLSNMAHTGSASPSRVRI